MGSWQVLVGGAQGCVGVLDCRPRALGAKLSQVLSNVADVLPDGGGGGEAVFGKNKKVVSTRVTLEEVEETCQRL